MLILQLTMPPSLNQKLGNIKHKTAWNDWKYRERKRILEESCLRALSRLAVMYIFT